MNKDNFYAQDLLYWAKKVAEQELHVQRLGYVNVATEVEGTIDISATLKIQMDILQHYREQYNKFLNLYLKREEKENNE